MRELPTGTVTLLFTDIEGSTRLLQELGRDAYVRALTDQRRLLREAFTRRGGVEVELQGDSFHFAFPEAREAVLAAAEAQQALAAHAWESEPIKVRIGIHTGEPIAHEGLYAGLDVHRAARVMQAGHGGQVLLSETTRALADALPVRELGLHRLKDLVEPVRLYQVGEEAFPPLKTLDATNLPMAASPLIGRERELAELLALLSDGHRLVTVTGPGGTGKTRLALQSAAELVGSYRDGVFWVPLAGLVDPELVLPTIAQTLGARDELDAFVRDRELLLLLDNLEHLLGAASALGKLLAGARGLRLLVTSRAPLRLAGEREYSLEPLPERDAVTLFTERARAAGRDVAPDESVAAICRRLDGLPLAVELAAARTRLLDPETLLSRLEHALPLLTGGARDAPGHQRTLSATIEWSYQLLDDDAKRLFARVSVFARGFSLAAAEQVADADLDALESLVELSLLKPIGESRFLMLETIREFARDRVEESGELNAVRRRHADHYLEFAEQGEPKLRGSDDREWLERLDTERDNFRAALAFAQERKLPELALRLVVALRMYWSARGSIAELRRWLDEALESAGDTLPEQRADALQYAALTAYHAAAYDETDRYAQQMLEVVRGLGDREREVSALSKLGAAAMGREQHQRSRAFMEEALELARELGKPARIALSLSNLASALVAAGEVERAAELCEESLAIGEGVVDSSSEAASLLNLAEARLQLGERGRAADAARKALRLAADRTDTLLAAEAILALVPTVASEDGLRATQLLGASAKLREEVGARVGPYERKQIDELEQALRRAIGDSFDVAFARGGEMTFDDAVGLGMGTGSKALAG